MRGALRRAADNRRALERQREHWTQTFAERADRYGSEPSEAARMAASLFRAAGYGHLLELGAGQGRDACFFAESGLRVDALDYALSAVAAVRAKALAAGLGALVTARQHDVRERLPFADMSFDACYAHMLFCMALTTGEIEALALEIHRVLRPEGLVVYTARSRADPDYRRGTARAEDTYEVGGFIVHFFGRELVDRLAAGYELVDVTEFEEGSLPRRLFRVTMRKAPVEGTAEG